MQSPNAQRHLRDAPGGQLEAAGLLSRDGGGGAAPPQPVQRWPPAADGVQLPGSLGEARDRAEDCVSRIAHVMHRRNCRIRPARQTYSPCMGCQLKGMATGWTEHRRLALA